MARDWIDYWTLGAYWAAAAGTWVAILAAILVGRWAKRTYESQRDALKLAKKQLQIVEDQLADARKKDHQENQLKRFRHGPYFKLFPMHLSSAKSFQAKNGVTFQREIFADCRDFMSAICDHYRETHGGEFGLMLQDVRDCDLDDIRAVWVNAVGALPCEMHRVPQLDHFVKHPVWALIYTGIPDQFQEARGGDMEIEYKTVNGYADLHVYAHQFGKLVWSRTVPQFVRLNSVK